MPKPRKKIKLTWAELKGQRNALARFELYLPTLQLKQQQLQMTIGQVLQRYEETLTGLQSVEERMADYEPVLRDRAGINIREMIEPKEVETTIKNMAGVRVPVFESVSFRETPYSLFSTPPWVDQALADFREKGRLTTRLKVLQQQMELLQAELKKVLQRVNLFEKIIIPETRENIRRIRIALGDAMTAAVARAKIAKAKLEEREHRRRLEGKTP
ncbi:MAG: V-type ATP synthase subunit D [Deltaproteobacteria bacterium]|nr:V-type ATP synthase subunit D [Deltaproteobacteria bacterium]